MGEKVKLPYVIDTFELNGQYHVDQRIESGDRRKKKAKRVYYERRKVGEQRRQYSKRISEKV